MKSCYRFGEFEFEGSNSEELKFLGKEIFDKNCYFVDGLPKNAKILDIGAHVGLAVGYFKKIAPDSKIIAVEPLSENLVFLRRNVHRNRFENVEIIEKAVAKKTGKRTLYADATDAKWYSTGGFIKNAWNGHQKSIGREVDTIQLSSLLSEKIDLLKIDIEGGEYEVLDEARASMVIVNKVIVEAHPVGAHSSDKVVKLLKSVGFETQIDQVLRGRDVGEKGLVIVNGWRD